MDSEETGYWEFPVFGVPQSRDLEVNAQRERITQSLLDAGYRNFRSIIELSLTHWSHLPGETSPDNGRIFFYVEFLNGIQRFAPEQIDVEVERGQLARENQAKYQERAKQKRQLKSLDNALRKQGLID